MTLHPSPILASLAIVMLLGSPTLARAEAPSTTKPKKEIIIYKQVAGCDIKADIYPSSSTSGKAVPAIVWIHGGGVINGNRESVTSQVRDFAFSNGYVLVLLDYRLAPETKLPEILGDLEDAFRWIRTEGAEKYHIDPHRIAVSGGSAGGFLTLSCGFRIKPAPQVLLSLFGYGEILSDWASKPSPHPRHNQKKISDDDYARQIGGPAVSDSKERKGNGGDIYVHGRQTGGWAKDISGFDPQREPEKFTPLLPLKNVTASYPPTVMIHGTADTDVPFEQSQLMARELEKNGVPFELHPIKNGEHGFGGGDPAEISEAYRQAFAFVKKRLE